MTAGILGALGILALARALCTLVGLTAGVGAAALVVGGSFLLGALVLEPSLAAAGGFLLASLTVLALVRWRAVPVAMLVLSLGLPVMAAWNPMLGLASFGPAHPVESLWAPQGGLLYRNPVLWGGFFGLVALARRDRLGVSLLLAVAAMLGVSAFRESAGSGTPASNARAAAVLAPLAVGLAVSLGQLERWARRRPNGLLFGGAVALGLGNLLFMEQYRRDMIPRDDTISFPRVAENSAALLARAVGSPLAWPANWLFSWRYRLPVDRYDEMAGQRLFQKGRAFAVVDVGDPGCDRRSLADGWSVRHPCGSEVCRQAEGRARMFVGLEEIASLTMRLRACGRGSLGVIVNGRRAGILWLGAGLEERTLLVPAGAWRRDLNEITLDPAGEALVDRVTFERPSQ